MPESRRRHIDPRAPLVLDTRELGRRAGSMRRARITVPAPSGLGTELIGVAAGAQLVLDVRLESVVEGILVTGSAAAPLVGECSRCLDPVQTVLEVPFQQLFVYPDLRGDLAGADGEDLGEVQEDRVDLEPVVRDAVVLALPLSPRCRPDCPGLCPTCGERVADLPPHHSHDLLDSRWAALAALGHNGTDDRAQPENQEN